MVTTIQISEDLKDKLSSRKVSSKDTYEEIIWDLLEDTLEINEVTKKEIELARKEYAQRNFVTHAQLKKDLGL